MGIWYICMTGHSGFVKESECLAGLTSGNFGVSPSESFLMYPTWKNFEEACK